MVVAVLYQVALPVIFRLEGLASGKVEMYPTVAKDGLFIQKIFFVVTSGLWFTLWAVKASLLALYKRLMTQVRTYIRLWWIVAVLCFIVSFFPLLQTRTDFTVPRWCCDLLYALML
jgi:hypothetical protein